MTHPTYSHRIELNDCRLSLVLTVPDAPDTSERVNLFNEVLQEIAKLTLQALGNNFRAQRPDDTAAAGISQGRVEENGYMLSWNIIFRCPANELREFLRNFEQYMHEHVLPEGAIRIFLPMFAD